MRTPRGNRQIISHVYTRLIQADKDMGNDYPQQWQQHTERSGNLIVPFERNEKATSGEVGGIDVKYLLGFVPLEKVHHSPLSQPQRILRSPATRTSHLEN